MLIPGLLSVTFRSLAPEAIIAMAVETGLEAITWAGDVHVPPGDTGQAKAVGRATREAGLAVAGYGSYYRAGVSEGAGPRFADVLDVAVVLGAPTIRIWAGDTGSNQTSADQRDRVIAGTQRIADLAAEAGLRIAFEYHADTLTDTAASALALHKAVNRPNVDMHWQPPNRMDFPGRLETLNQVVPYLANLHVFHWQPTQSGQVRRLPLSEGETDWRAYFRAATTADDRVHYALLEFVANDDSAQFRADATALRSWINAVPKA